MDGDRRTQPTFAGKPRFTKSITGVGFEVQGGHVVAHQTGRPTRLGAARAADSLRETSRAGPPAGSPISEFCGGTICGAPQ